MWGLDIYRTAKVLIDSYGDGASLHAANRAYTEAIELPTNHRGLAEEVAPFEPAHVAPHSAAGSPAPQSHKPADPLNGSLRPADGLFSPHPAPRQPGRSGAVLGRLSGAGNGPTSHRIIPKSYRSFAAENPSH
jgi:hypothetical protein